jgi:hypothetical protein
LPARAESLEVTERYRSGMLRLRQQGQREAKRIWNGVNPDDLDATFNLGTLELTVTTLQREAARLSSAYLSTFIASELGESERPPALSVWDKAFGGGDLREALRSAVIKTKQEIGEGEDPREATNRNRIVLVNDVGLFIDTAARESLRQGMVQDDRIVGYQRALKGTCGACAGNVAVETSVELPSIPLRIHPNCQCVTEPVVRPRSPREGAREANTRLNAEQLRSVYDDYFGPFNNSFEMNGLLRTGKWERSFARPRLTEAEVRESIKRLDAAMDRMGPIGTPVESWRQVKDLAFKVGQTFTDKGYGSTSATNLYEALGRVPGGANLHLTIDSKVKALWGVNPSEGELLLQRGCRYVVRSMTKNKGGGYDIEATVLPPR